MDFDFGTLKEGLASLAAAIGIYKQIKDSLPEGSKKEEADEALNSTLAIQESTLCRPGKSGQALSRN